MPFYSNLKSAFFNLSWRVEILAGLTVAMTMIPESLSFAILAGLPPIMGLYAAFIMGIITGIFGGRPGMVSGGAGATIIVMMALISSHGIQYLLAAVCIAGLLQILVGILKLGKFIRLIPQPVMFGFLNGLAVVIFMSQLEQFKTNSGWMLGSDLFVMLGLVLLTIAIVYFLPMLTKAIPASLAAIIVVSLVVTCFQIDTKLVEDIASVKGDLPQFNWPVVPFNFDTLQVIFPYAVVMASVGLIESLLTLNIVDEITETKGSSNKEAIAQGSANILNGLFGGMGGCAMIAQTFVNINSGARTKVSSVTSALTILLIILVASPVIEIIPMAALVGVMVVVAFTTFQWGFFKMIKKMPRTDIFIGIIVALITIFLHNLALAVLVGVLVSALVFAWDNAKRIRARKSFDEYGNKVYKIYGPLFFGSTMSFLEKFDVQADPKRIIIDFNESRVADMSAITALEKVNQKYLDAGKEVVVRHLSADSRRLLRQAQIPINIMINEASDPTYYVMK